MSHSPRPLLTRLFTLVALTGSVVLLVEHFRPNPQLCPFDSGCEQVLSSAFGRPLGVPLPLVGAVTFSVLFLLSLLPTPQGQRFLALLALAAGGVGLVLILVQVFILHQVCPYCLLVDSSALVVAVVQVAGWWRGPVPTSSQRMRLLWLGAAAVTLAAAVILSSAGSRETSAGEAAVPPQVTALWEPGKINVVELADFQCPRCRQMHAVLLQLLREKGDRVHFVRVAIPMPFHAQARDAARAYRCACQQGKGDVLAEALFSAPDLHPNSCERLAAAAGVSLPAFRTCLADPRIDEDIDADLAWVQPATPEGLPVIWIQDQMLSGVQPLVALQVAADAAEERLARSQSKNTTDRQESVSTTPGGRP